MAQRGKDFVLLIGDGGTPTENFDKVGGLRSNGFSNTEELVDISDKDRTSQQIIKARFGNKDRSLSGSGVAKKNDVGLERARTSYEDNTGKISNWQVVLPGVGTYQGPMVITQFDFSGDDAAEVTYDMTLEVTGDLTFTAEP